MKAAGGGRERRGKSWNEVVANLLSANGKTARDSTAAERVRAAKALEDGRSATVAGVKIDPKEN